MRALLAQAKEASEIASNADTESVPIHPRANVVANLLILRGLSIKIQERLADEDQHSEKVFRYSSSNTCAPIPAFPSRGVPN